MALEKLLSQLRLGLNSGLIILATALPSYTAEACKPKNPKQQAQETYNSFSKEERKSFDRFFDVDFSKLRDFEVLFLQDSYKGLFKKGTFDIRKMTLGQKLKIYNYSQESEEDPFFLK